MHILIKWIFYDRLIQRVLKQFILLGRGNPGLRAFGAGKEPPTAATASAADEESGETQPLMPSNESTGNVQYMSSVWACNNLPYHNYLH